jgi:hypothetical protein
VLRATPLHLELDETTDEQRKQACEAAKRGLNTAGRWLASLIGPHRVPDGRWLSLVALWPAAGAWDAATLARTEFAVWEAARAAGIPRADLGFAGPTASVIGEQRDGRTGHPTANATAAGLAISTVALALLLALRRQGKLRAAALIAAACLSGQALVLLVGSWLNAPEATLVALLLPCAAGLLAAIGGLREREHAAKAMPLFGVGLAVVVSSVALVRCLPVDEGAMRPSFSRPGVARPTSTDAIVEHLRAKIARIGWVSRAHRAGDAAAANEHAAAALAPWAEPLCPALPRDVAPELPELLRWARRHRAHLPASLRDLEPTTDRAGCLAAVAGLVGPTPVAGAVPVLLPLTVNEWDLRGTDAARELLRQRLPRGCDATLPTDRSWQQRQALVRALPLVAAISAIAALLGTALLFGRQPWRLAASGGPLLASIAAVALLEGSFGIRSLPLLVSCAVWAPLLGAGGSPMPRRDDALAAIAPPVAIALGALALGPTTIAGELGLVAAAALGTAAALALGLRWLLARARP